MTKDQLTELIQRRLTTKVHEQVIEKYLELAYGQLLDILFANDESLMDQYVSLYYSVPVISIANQESYSMIPAKIVTLSGPGSGVRSIYTTTMSPKFAPMTRGSLDVLDGMEVMESDPIIAYVTQGNVVRFIDMPVEIASVNMGIVKSLSEADGDEEVILPAGADQQIVEMALNLLLGVPPVKKSNDNTSNPV